MEDASISIEDYSAPNHYLFGVFDGHGGNNKVKLRIGSSKICSKAFFNRIDYE
jgi:hypothetical protein